MSDTKKIALLLQIIVDELYIARTDKEFEGMSGGGPDLWFNRGGRDEMTRDIRKMRDDAGHIN